MKTLTSPQATFLKMIAERGGELVAHYVGGTVMSSARSLERKGLVVITVEDEVKIVLTPTGVAEAKRWPAWAPSAGSLTRKIPVTDDTYGPFS